MSTKVICLFALIYSSLLYDVTQLTHSNMKTMVIRLP